MTGAVAQDRQSASTGKAIPLSQAVRKTLPTALPGAFAAFSRFDGDTMKVVIIHPSEDAWNSPGLHKCASRLQELCPHLKLRVSTCLFSYDARFCGLGGHRRFYLRPDLEKELHVINKKSDKMFPHPSFWTPKEERLAQRRMRYAERRYQQRIEKGWSTH